jgi:hypothetical protein
MEPPSLMDLPPELLAKVARRLRARELARLACTGRLLRAAAEGAARWKVEAARGEGAAGGGGVGEWPWALRVEEQAALGGHPGRIAALGGHSLAWVARGAEGGFFAEGPVGYMFIEDDGEYVEAEGRQLAGSAMAQVAMAVSEGEYVCCTRRL